MKNHIKKIIMVIIMIGMVLPQMVITYASDENDRPVLKVESLNYDQLSAGQEVDLKIQLSNVGSYAARHVEMSLKSIDGSPIKVTNITTLEYERYLNPGDSVELTYRVKVDSEAESGVYGLSFTADFINTEEVSFQYNETLNFEVFEKLPGVTYHLEKLAPQEAVMAGEGFDLSFDFMNTSELVMKDVVISLSNLSESGFSNRSINQVKLNNVSAGEQEVVNFELYASDELLKGAYPVTVTISYKDHYNDEIEETFDLYVSVEEEGETALLIKNINKSKNTIGENDSFDLTFGIENVGTIDAKNVEVYIEHSEALVPVTQNRYIIQELLTGTTQSVTFSIEATDEVETQNYPITIYVEDEAGNIIKQYTGINAVGSSEETNKPKVMVGSVITDPEDIYVGDTFNLTFDVINTSSSANIQNMKITLNESGKTSSSSTDSDSVQDSVFIPVNQSNSLYVTMLTPGERRELSIPIKTTANTSGGVYGMEVNFTYEDSDGNEYTDTDNINLQISDKRELSISDVKIGSSLGNSYTLEVDFYNTGKVDIQNLLVDIEGVENTTNSNYYVGTFSTGSMDIYDVQVNGQMPEVIEGTIIFSFDNTFGEKEIIEHPFSITNETMNEQGFGMNMGAGMNGEAVEAFNPARERVEQESSNLPWMIGGLVIIAAGGAAFYIIRKKKKNKSEDL